MPVAWNKGLSKSSHPSVKKISDTMRRKAIDNFKSWREEQKRLGRIPSRYPVLRKNADLAELIGVVLGDGHIEHYPRTEALYILSNANNLGFVKRYRSLVTKIFGKEPDVAKMRSSHCIRLRIYQKHISRRLQIPSGSRKHYSVKIPQWIMRNSRYLQRYLRGLYEAEGSYHVHVPTYTYKFLFSNKNQSLLTCVENALRKLGFHPHRSDDKIQLSRKEEVKKARILLAFRRY